MWCNKKSVLMSFVQSVVGVIVMWNASHLCTYVNILPKTISASGSWSRLLHLTSPMVCFKILPYPSTFTYKVHVWPLEVCVTAAGLYCWPSTMLRTHPGTKPPFWGRKQGFNDVWRGTCPTVVNMFKEFDIQVEDLNVPLVNQSRVKGGLGVTVMVL